MAKKQKIDRNEIINAKDLAKYKKVSSEYDPKRFLVIHCLSCLNDFVAGNRTDTEIRDELNKMSETLSNTFRQIQFFKVNGHFDKTVTDALVRWSKSQSTPEEYTKMFRSESV